MKNSFLPSFSRKTPSSQEWIKGPEDIKEKAFQNIGKFGRNTARSLFERIGEDKINVRFSEKANEFEVGWLRKPSSSDLALLEDIVDKMNFAEDLRTPEPRLRTKGGLFKVGKPESLSKREARGIVLTQKIITGSNQAEILEKRIKGQPIIKHNANLSEASCPNVRVSDFKKGKGSTVLLNKSESSASIENVAFSLEGDNTVTVSSGGAVLERDATGSLFAHIFEKFLAQTGKKGQEAKLVEIAAHSGEQTQAITGGAGANVSIIYGDKSRAFLESQWGEGSVHPLFEDAFTVGSLGSKDSTSEPSRNNKKFMASKMRSFVDRLNAGEKGPFFISRNDWRGENAAGSAMGKADLKLIQDGAKYLVQKGGLKIPGGEKLKTQEAITNWFLDNCVQPERNLLPPQVVKMAREVAAKNPNVEPPLFLIPAGFEPKDFQVQLGRDLSDNDDPKKNVASLGLNPKANKLEKQFFQWLISSQGHQAVREVSDDMGLGLTDVVDPSDYAIEDDTASIATLEESEEFFDAIERDFDPTSPPVAQFIDQHPNGVATELFQWLRTPEGTQARERYNANSNPRNTEVRPASRQVAGNATLPNIPRPQPISAESRNNYFQPARDARGLEPSGIKFDDEYSV